MDKIMVTKSIWDYTWAPQCQLCGTVPGAGDIFYKDGDSVYCPYCGWEFSFTNSAHIIWNSKPWRGRNTAEERKWGPYDCYD